MAAKLDRRTVADAALRLLNEVGLDGLTLRLIAAGVGVKAPALYWHFTDKQALLDEMATEMMRRMTADTTRLDGDWRETLRVRMRGLREHLLRYRDGAKVFSGTRFTDMSHAAPMEANLRMLAEAGFTLPAAARVWATAYNYTIGFVIEEQAMASAGGRPAYDLDARAERMSAQPLAAAAGHEIFEDSDQGFEQGLDAIVAGVEATLLPPGEAPGQSRMACGDRSRNPLP